MGAKMEGSNFKSGLGLSWPGAPEVFGDERT
jgi:hypothetical protein